MCIKGVVKKPIRKVRDGVLLLGFWSLMGPALAYTIWRYQKDQDMAACNKDYIVV